MVVVHTVYLEHLGCKSFTFSQTTLPPLSLSPPPTITTLSPCSCSTTTSDCNTTNNNSNAFLLSLSSADNAKEQHITIHNTTIAPIELISFTLSSTTPNTHLTHTLSFSFSLSPGSVWHFILFLFFLWWWKRVRIVAWRSRSTCDLSSARRRCRDARIAWASCQGSLRCVHHCHTQRTLW